jgi:Protein of unknown function (DUF2511)
MKSILILILIVSILSALLINCTSPSDQSSSQIVQESEGTVATTGKKLTSLDFGEKWPFTISEGIVKCTEYGGVVFEANGKVYALNGTAQMHSDEYGYANVAEIWAVDEKMAQAMKDNGYSKEEIERLKKRISISAVIDAGLELCQ